MEQQEAKGLILPDISVIILKIKEPSPSKEVHHLRIPIMALNSLRHQMVELFEGSRQVKSYENEIHK